jgi:hypothetical protein
VLPDQFSGTSAFIYPIDENAQYAPIIVVTAPTDEPTPTKAPLIGTSPPDPTMNPDNQDPTAQTPRPLSFNLIADNPLISFVIIFAIVVSITLAIWSARRPRHHDEAIPEPAPPPPPVAHDVSMQTEKYCIHCGAQNKGYAVYCEKCGKQIN